MPTKNKKHSIEYRLLVVPTFDETVKKEGILFLLETTKLFTNFSYFIDIRDELNGNTLRWNLHGLKAPTMNLPATGTAQFRKVYFNLPKTIKFSLIKKENNQASTELAFLSSSVKTKDKLVNFLKIYTDVNTFELNRTADTEPPTHKPDFHRTPVAVKQTLTKKKKT